MSDYLHVEQPFLDELAALGWKVTDQGQAFIPLDPAKSLRFHEWCLPRVLLLPAVHENSTLHGRFSW